MTRQEWTWWMFAVVGDCSACQRFDVDLFILQATLYTVTSPTWISASLRSPMLLTQRPISLHYHGRCHVLLISVTNSLSLPWWPHWRLWSNVVWRAMRQRPWMICETGDRCWHTCCFQFAEDRWSEKSKLIVVENGDIPYLSSSFTAALLIQMSPQRVLRCRIYHQHSTSSVIKSKTHSPWHHYHLNFKTMLTAATAKRPPTPPEPKKETRRDNHPTFRTRHPWLTDSYEEAGNR